MYIRLKSKTKWTKDLLSDDAPTASPAFHRYLVAMAEVLARLRGQRVVVQDLEGFFHGWAQAVHPQVDKLRSDVNVKLERSVIATWTKSRTCLTCGSCRVFGPGERLKQLQAADVALFAASWWPYAPYDRLMIVTMMSMWASLVLNSISSCTSD
nr:hypothetical protein CFP56_65480 [Quercus suber]